MHHTNYFDTYPGFTPAKPASLPQTEPIPPLSRRERKALRRAGGKRRGGRVAVVVFALFLLMLGGGLATLLALNYTSGGTLLDLLPNLPQMGPSYQVPNIPWEDYGLPADLPATTVERAPTEQGITLTLHPAAENGHTFQEIYKKCAPSIVSVLTAGERGSASGTGVVLTEDGYIVTNYHVIQGGSAVEVALMDGRSFSALLVGGDQTNDLAVLKIDAKHLPFAEFGSSDDLRVGDVALAIGNPLGQELRGTMTEGIISAIDRDVRSDGNTMTLIQTSAALNSGNSGGALLNAHGQVVGITNMKMTSYYDTIEGLGFAIPSATAKTVVEELIATGHVSGRPTLGITGSALSPTAAETGDLVPGVYLSDVDPKSDAWRAGMRPGDVITQCQGETVATVEDINAIKADCSAGDRLDFRLYREGEYIDLKVRLMEKYELDD